MDALSTIVTKASTVLQNEDGDNYVILVDGGRKIFARTTEPTSALVPPAITWGTVKNGTSGTSQAPNAPTGTNAAGDLGLIFVVYDDTVAPTTPAGWTLIDGGANSSELYIFAKILTAAEAWPTIAGPTNDYVMIAGRVLAAAHTVVTPSTDIIDGTSATGTSTAPNPPSVALSSASAYLVIAAAAVDLTTGNTISGSVSGYTDVTRTVSASSTTSVALGVATKTVSAVTSEDPGAFTASASRAWRAATIAIKGIANVYGEADGDVWLVLP